jgi:hypothetical protein
MHLRCEIRLALSSAVALGRGVRSVSAHRADSVSELLRRSWWGKRTLFGLGVCAALVA